MSELDVITNQLANEQTADDIDAVIENLQAVSVALRQGSTVQSQLPALHGVRGTLQGIVTNAEFDANEEG